MKSIFIFITKIVLFIVCNTSKYVHKLTNTTLKDNATLIQLKEGNNYDSIVST